MWTRWYLGLLPNDSVEQPGQVARFDSELNHPGAAGGHRWFEGVKVVVTDGSESYRSAIRTHLGAATHVIDRFHLARWFASGLIEVRRRIQRIGPKGSRPAYHPEVFGSRYLQLRRADRLEPEARARLERILTTDPDLAQAWELYQALHRIYLAEDNEGANEALGEFLDRHYQRSLPEFEPLLDTNYPIRAPLYAGRPNWGLHATTTPRSFPKRHLWAPVLGLPRH